MSAKRAINLARVSTPRQAELYSLDYQIEQERAYDTEMGFTVVAEFKDDTSGRKIERDGLEEACQMLERGEADVLVTWKFDRLHRNYVNSVVLRERIRRAGKEIHYAQSRSVSGTTARERLPEDLQFLMAEIDADDIAERTTGGKRRKIVEGKKWLGLNRPPYGYRKVGQGRNAVLEVDEEQAKIVRLIFEWYVRGDGDRGPMTTLQLASKLTSMNVPTPQDLIPGRANMKKRGYAQWSRATPSKILRHSAYNGVFYQYRFKYVNNTMRANPNRDEWVGVPVPRIVDEELWDAAQRKMDSGIQFSSRGAILEYLVGRRIFCECGYKMRSSGSGKAYTDKKGHAHDYRYHQYRCFGKSKDAANPCTMPVINVAKLDARVWEWVKEEIANPAILQRKLQEIQTQQQEERSGARDALEALYTNKDTIEAELLRLGRLYATDMPIHLIEQLISEQNHKLKLTVDEIRKREQENESPLTDDMIRSLVGFSWKLGEHLAAIEERFDAKRVVIDGLDVRVTVVRKTGELWLNLQCILRDDIVSIPL